MFEISLLIEARQSLLSGAYWDLTAELNILREFSLSASILHFHVFTLQSTLVRVAVVCTSFVFATAIAAATLCYKSRWKVKDWGADVNERFQGCDYLHTSRKCNKERESPGIV